MPVSALANTIMNRGCKLKRTIWVSYKESERLPVGRKQRRPAPFFLPGDGFGAA
jgi:hypothetical protein